MARPLVHPVHLHRALFVAIALVLTVLRLLPMSTEPVELPGPDLMLCFTFAWILRRPDYVPVLLIAAVFFFDDLMFMRPPGLWAVIVVFGTEFLRGRQPMMRELGILIEWGMVGTVMVAMMLVYRLAYALAFLDQPPLMLAVLQVAATVIAYPVVVAASHVVFGLRKSAPGEVDGLGRRM